jgi:hypothetical protein
LRSNYGVPLTITSVKIYSSTRTSPNLEAESAYNERCRRRAKENNKLSGQTQTATTPTVQQLERHGLRDLNKTVTIAANSTVIYGSNYLPPIYALMLLLFKTPRHPTIGV